MSSLLVLSYFITTSITLQNPMFDRYTIIPPLGRIEALAVSLQHVCMLTDNYLVLFNKADLTIDKTFAFNEKPRLVGYDRYTNDIWVVTESHLIRITVPSYSIREFTGEKGVTRFGIDDKYVYLDGTENKAHNKQMNMLEWMNTWPGGITWYQKTNETNIRKYTFLAPYYYSDDMLNSDRPFTRYPITALYDDGMDLYVGTDGYGLLKYNTVSWAKQHIVYGPLDLDISRVRTLNNEIYFVSSSGISQYIEATRSWEYSRYASFIRDFLPQQNGIIIGLENRLVSRNAGVSITVGTLDNDILALSQDDTCMYIGTRSGMYKMYHNTTELIGFGPDRYPVYSIHISKQYLFVGGELALYGYDPANNVWAKILPFGVKKITQIDSTLFCLSTQNQLLRYSISDTLTGSDSSWVLLPYFNVYDIAVDDQVVYCASYAGAHYYDPQTDQYRVIYNLPRIMYKGIFIIGQDIFAVADNALYSLPKKYRD